MRATAIRHPTCYQFQFSPVESLQEITADATSEYSRVYNPELAAVSVHFQARRSPCGDASRLNQATRFREQWMASAGRFLTVGIAEAAYRKYPKTCLLR